LQWILAEHPKNKPLDGTPQVFQTDTQFRVSSTMRLPK